MLRNFLRLFRQSGPPYATSQTGKITVIGSPTSGSPAEGSTSGSARTSTFGPELDLDDFLSSSKDLYVPPDVVHHNREGLAPLSAAQLIQANRALIDQALLISNMQ